MPTLSTVSIETTIPSYLTARNSNNPVIAGQQEITRKWWDERRSAFRLFISEAVVAEARKGDGEAATNRLRIIDGIPELEIDEQSVLLTNTILASKVIPLSAGADAAHVAIASRYGIDFLLTWNCRHIANAEIVKSLERIVARQGYVLPVLRTPYELLGGEYEL